MIFIFGEKEIWTKHLMNTQVLLASVPRESEANQKFSLNRCRDLIGCPGNLKNEWFFW